ncbi:hypothetical protein PM082_008170 [Marasmius tenuissimus]|nr:hypothetical protein PM082_008170 [Marasmius tenuissimus]
MTCLHLSILVEAIVALICAVGGTECMVRSERRQLAIFRNLRAPCSTGGSIYRFSFPIPKDSEMTEQYHLSPSITHEPIFAYGPIKVLDAEFQT